MAENQEEVDNDLEALDPLATEEEYEVYKEEIQAEQEEEEMLAERFERAVRLDEW